MLDDKHSLIPSSSSICPNPTTQQQTSSFASAMKPDEKTEEESSEEAQSKTDKASKEVHEHQELNPADEVERPKAETQQKAASKTTFSSSTSLTLLPTKLVHKVVEKIQATTNSIAVVSSSKEGKEPAANSAGATEAQSTAESSAGAAPAATLYHRFVTSFEAAIQDLTSDVEEQKVKQKLPSLDLEGVAAYIREESPKNVLFMVGAGISTSAGIPDFRSPGTGLYANLERFQLPNPQMIFDIGFFRKNPEPFYVMVRELFHEGVRPTVCHYFIKLMDEKGMLKRCFTQNIDSLEYTVNIREDKVVTAHGSHHTSTCLSCKRKYTKEWLEQKLKDKEKMVPRCDACNGVVKPDIVFFGEKLPNRFFSAALADFPKCDLLIVMGTSLVVQPFASMVGQVPKDCPRLLINLTPAGQDEGSVLFGAGFDDGAGLKYGMEGNVRDVFWQGSCDEGAEKLARMLGWETELKGLVEKGNKKVGTGGEGTTSTLL